MFLAERRSRLYGSGLVREFSFLIVESKSRFGAWRLGVSAEACTSSHLIG
jgi:hypothetical protein